VMKHKRIHNIFQYYINLKLRQKLLLSYIILILLPLFLYSFITYNNFSNILQTKALFSADKSYSQAYSYITDKFNKVIKTMDVVLQNPKINQIVSSSTPNTDIFQQMDDMIQMDNFLENLEDKTVTDKIRLYVKDGLIYANKNATNTSHLFNLKDIQNTKWVQKLYKNGVRILWCPSDYFEGAGNSGDKTISAVTFLRSSNDFSEMVGLLRVDIARSKLAEIMSNSNTIKNCITYIQNSEGIIVLSSEHKSTNILKIKDSLAYHTSATSEWLTTKVGKENVFYHSKLIPASDWHMVTVIPYKEIFSESSKLRTEAFLQVLIIASIAYVLAFFLSTSITNRISHLISKMKNIQNGNLSPIIQSSDKDEIGDLIENYNYMLSRIKLLLEAQYKMGLEVKSSELKVLQAQINPHFLYNTLDMVVCLSQENKYNEIEYSVKALAKFYKLSLSKGKELVKIQDELYHVSSFIDIQNIRFKNKINFIIDLDEYIQEFEILKITLQPIIENAIVHGIQGRESKEGTIVISGTLVNDEIIICINDDGIGIPKDKLDMILSGSIISTIGSSYGIKNINERLKLFYGDKYGLYFKSEYGKGTTVEILIPARKVDDPDIDRLL
jgi:two-component system, sensor histidine kinase YesM